MEEVSSVLYLATHSPRLTEVKEIMWNNIVEKRDEIWPCIHIIFEHKELMEKSNQTISIINAESGEMGATTNNIIKFLNSKNR